MRRLADPTAVAGIDVTVTDGSAAPPHEIMSPAIGHEESCPSLAGSWPVSPAWVACTDGSSTGAGLALTWRMLAHSLIATPWKRSSAIAMSMTTPALRLPCGTNFLRSIGRRLAVQVPVLDGTGLARQTRLLSQRRTKMLVPKMRESLLAAALLGLIACAGDSGDAGDNSADTTAIAGEAAAQASADVDFLRQMSDHHEGLVLIAERAHERATDDSVRSVAENLHMKQAAERDSMVAMLSTAFQQQHTPQAMAKNRAQADSVAAQSGTEADRYFLNTTIAHHREGIGMIDQHFGHLTNPEVRSMAEKMKGDQQREIQELEGKLADL